MDLSGILSENQIEKINESSLQILAEIGIRVTHLAIRRILLESGAREGNDSNLLFPPSLVQEWNKKAPSSVLLSDLAGNKTNIYPGATPLFWTGNALYYSRGKEREALTRSQYVEFCRVADRLPHVHGITATSIADYPPSTRDFVGFRAMAENTRKHLRPQIFTSAGVKIILEMADILLDGKNLRENPILSIGVTAESPLKWGDFALDVIRVSSGYGIPLAINSEVIVGATSPVTLAGSLVLANAEALCGIVITQILEPERPVIFNLGFSHTFDMACGETLTGAPEGGLLGAAGSRIAQYHKLPSTSWMSTESKTVDSQASFEKTLLGLLYALGEVNLIWGVGNLESTLTICPEQAVIDDEIAGGILRAREGIAVDEDHLAVGVIKEVKDKTDYLAHEHTIRHFRKELRISNFLSRERRSIWEKKGSLTLFEQAAERVRSLLGQPHLEYLNDRQKKNIEGVERKWLQKSANG